MAKVELYLVGLGIHFRKHLTIEAHDVLRKCSQIIHIGDNHRWLKSLNPNVINLERLYWTGEDREIVYAKLKKRVLAEVAKKPGTAFVTYGHPLLFDDLNNELVRDFKRRRRKIEVIAGISSLDTLAIDLTLDYGEGAQIYDCTELVLNRYSLNRRVHALLLQLAEYNFDFTTNALKAKTPKRYAPLVKYLRRYYPAEHPIKILYTPDGYNERRHYTVRLKDLDKAQLKIFPGTTLYVPPFEG